MRGTTEAGEPYFVMEPVRGIPITEYCDRSVIYSLGVLLYELLTGDIPFDRESLKSAGFDEMRRIIRKEEPRRPSALVSTLRAEALSTVASRRNCQAHRLRDSLKGELDWIVMKKVTCHCLQF